MPTEEGNYYGTIKQAVLTTSKKGHPQLAIAFDITHHAVSGNWVELSDAIERTMFLSLYANAKSYSQEKLRMLNFNGDFDEPGLTTEGVALTCRHEMYENKPRERWELTAYEGGGEYNPEKADPETIRGLNAWWTATQGNKPTGAPSAPTGDEIPY